MTKRITRHFSVTEIKTDYVWLKLLEGKKRGLEFAVYADDKILNKLSQGDEVEASIKSQNRRETEWEIEEITIMKN